MKPDAAQAVLAPRLGGVLDAFFKLMESLPVDEVVTTLQVGVGGWVGGYESMGSEERMV
jgi:hypothetical protein